jgi:hypothetical protein
MNEKETEKMAVATLNREFCERDNDHQPPTRLEVRRFACSLLRAMQIGEIATIDQARDFAWDLVEFNTTKGHTVHKLSCIALRLRELKTDIASQLAVETEALASRMTPQSLDRAVDSGDDAGCYDTDGLVYPYPDDVGACRQLAAQIEDIGLGIQELYAIREVVYPVVNVRRVDDAQALRSALPKLLSGGVTAIDFFVKLTKALSNPHEDSHLAKGGTDAGTDDLIDGK